MPVIAIREFQGTRPRVNNPRLLGFNEAVIADNCKLWGGNLRGWRKDANVESVADNFLVRSEEFDNAAWLKDDIFSVTVNSDLGADGTTTADKVISSSVSAQHRVKQSATFPAGRVTGSFHAKDSGVPSTTILMFQSAATVGSWLIDLTLGVNQVTTPTGPGNPVGVITQEANGLLRISLEVDSDGTAMQMMQYVGSGTTTGNDVDGVVFWGGMMNAGSVLPYRKTIAAALQLAKSIYFFGNQFWFRWKDDVDAVRGPIAGDTSERTYFTSDNDVPRFTFDTLATTGVGPEYPIDSHTLGIPAPLTGPTAVINPISKTITAIVNELGSGSGTTNNITLTGIVTDGDSVTIKCKFKFTVVAEFTETAQIVFTIKRGAKVVGQTTVDLKAIGQTGEPDFAIVEFTLEAKDSPPAGTHVYTFQSEHTFNGTPTSTPRVFTFSARYNKVEITIGAHNTEEGSFIKVTDVLGMEEVNQDKLTVLAGVTATKLFVAVDTSQVYISGGTLAVTFVDTDRIDSAWVMTYVATVSGKDQEGPPSPASSILAIGIGEQVDLTALLVAPAGDFTITAKRIYRTAVASDGSAAFQFLAEITEPTTVFTDTIKPIDLGETLLSTDWDPPPTDMQGIIEIHESFLCGFSGNELIPSEPNQPHAWPAKYRLTVAYPIVAIANYGSSIFIGTTGTPFVATGALPGELSMERIEVNQACVSKRSMVDMGYGVLYASPDGLVYVSTGKIDVATTAYFTKDEWSDLKPSSIIAARYDERYVAFFDTGTKKGGFVFDPRERDAALTFLDFHADEAWMDPLTGDLYLVLGGFITKFDGTADTARDYTWKSKEFSQRRHTNMAVGLVHARTYPVTFSLLANKNPDTEIMEVVHTEIVQDAQPFRLSAGYLADKWQIQLEGNVAVDAVYVATSLEELRAVA